MKLFTQDTKVQALRRAPLFEDLSRKELVQLAPASEDLEVAPGKCCVTRATWDTSSS